VAGLVALAAVLWGLHRAERRRIPQRILDHGVVEKRLDVTCPAMKLSVSMLRVVPQKTFTGWGYRLICADPAGCEGRVKLTFHYLADGKPGEISVTRTLHLGRGQNLRDGFLQRPVVRVEEITKVEGKLLAPGGRGTVSTPGPW